MPAVDRRDAARGTVIRLVLGASLLALAVFGLPDIAAFHHVPATSIQEPTAEMKSIVAPVVKVVSTMSIADRLWLKTIYENTAKVVEVDGESGEPVVSTTEGLRAVHVAVLKFVWRGLAENRPNKYEGLAKAIDDAIEAAIGNDAVALTPDLRSRAVEVYEAIAWAGLGKDG